MDARANALDELNDDDPHTEPAMSADSLKGSPSKHFLYHPAIKHFSDRPEVTPHGPKSKIGWI